MNINLFYFPPNTTSHMQLLDAEIFRAFKAYYRRELVREYIQCAKEGKPQNVHLRWNLRATASSWEEVTQCSIKNCWRRSGLLCSSPPEVEEEAEGNITLAELQRAIRRLHSEAPESTAENFVAEDDTPTPVLHWRMTPS